MNHEKYTQSILSGVKTWAQSLFVTKERAKDLYYTERGKLALLKDQSLSFTDQGGIYVAEITDNDIVNLASGESITIRFDGEDYELKTSNFAISDTMTYVVAGNRALGNAGEDTGEPFLLMVIPGNMAMVGTSMADAMHKVGIYTYGDIVHKIKSKYLPDHKHDWNDLPALPNNEITFEAAKSNLIVITDVEYADLRVRMIENQERPVIVLRLNKDNSGYWYEYPTVLYCTDWTHSDNGFFNFTFNDGLDKYIVTIRDDGQRFCEYRVSIGEGLTLDDNGAIGVSIGEGLTLDDNGAIGVSIGDGLSLDVNGAIRANIASIPPTDWNENDSTSASYIKNRICYSELIPDKIIATTYPDEWLSFNRVTDVNLRYSWIHSSIKREVAKEALYDGMLCLMDMTKVGGNGSYTMYGAADRIEDTSSGSVYYVFGNRYLLNDVSMDDFGITVPLGSDIDTGDKFVVVILPNTDSDQIDAIVFTSYGLTDADKTDIKTVIENVTTIDPKYLPDEVVLESELESSIPTKTSDLTNDSGFITTADIPEGAAASTTSPKMDGTAAVGTELAFARGDHAHPSDTSRVPVTRTINGKALSSNITLSASDVNADAYGAASSALSSAKSYTDTQVNELKNGNVTVNHATNADEANHAASADIAGEADHAVLADNATNANHATSADSATKATQDGNGKVIATTYETKADAASKLTEAKGYTDQMVGELGEGFEGVIRQMYADDITEGGAPTIREIAADEAGDALADAKSYADSKVAAIDYPVDSVNGKTGAVSLTYSDVGAAASSHGTHVTYSTTAPVMDGTASVGSAATVARSDHKHPTDTSRVPTSRTVNGKALSANITLSASDVGADASGAAATALTDAKSYTDTKISALINSAPTTLDTLGEIAAAMEDNADVVGALETAVGNKANAADLTSHVNNKSNPHGVSLSQLGVTATAAELNYMDGVTSNVQTQLNGKASSSHSHDEYVTDNFSALAVRDKGNNRVIVTASQKDDIVSIVCDDGINVVGTASKEENGDYVMGQILIEGVPAGTGYGVVKSGGDVTITNGVITVNDDSHNHTIANVDGLQTALDGKAASSHGTHVSYSTTAPVMDGTAAVGTASTVARSDHKHPSDTSRVPTTRKVNGKALSADITLSASDVSAAASSHTHGNITNAGAIGTAANKAVITTTNGVLTTGTVPVAAGGTGATTAAAALTNLGLTATAAELNIMDGVTATAAEINKLDGLAAKTAELNYVIGVTSNIQTQLNTKATTGYVNDQIDGVLVALESHATGHAPSNAEKNQNAFSNVTVGATTIAADTTTDTLTLVAGDNVELTPDATNDKITINALNSGFDIIYAGATTLNSAGGVSDLTIDGGNGVSVSGNASDNSITISGVAATTTTPGVMSASDKTKLDYTNVAYGTCATGAATAAKFVNLSGNSKWALTSGSIVHVFFSETNTASNPTLNVNSTGAKNIYYGASQITTSSLGYAGTADRLMTFVYDGTQYRFAGWGYDSNTTYTNVKLGHGYATCSTAAATTAKVGTLASYTLTTGGIVAVKFTYAVPASATLNINSKGAKAIYHRGAAIKAGVIEAGDLATFMYNGSQYHLLSVDRDKDTTYTHPTYTAKSSGLYKVTVDGTGHVSAATAVAKADITALGIPAQDTTYSAASTSAAGLMSAADKTKLDGIATGANAYSHPTYTAKSSGLYKVTVDSTGHVSAATAVAKADITGLGIPAQDTTYSAATQSAAGLMPATDKAKVDGLLTPITTAGTGSAYTATVAGITALTKGVSFVMVPHVVSASTSPTLNVNSLGAKSIKRRLSTLATSVQNGYNAAWLAANQPFRMTYDGTYWIAEGMNKPVAADLYGTVAIDKGGTGATTAAAALTALGAAAADHNHANDGINPMYMEFFPGENATNGGYIDFHYANSTDDYTTRIIESQSGQLKVEGTMQVADTSDTASGARVRNIMVSTTDLTAGTSKLATGRIWFCYE